MDPYNSADAQAPVANPYAAPAARVAQPVAAGGDFVKSSRGARLGAVLLDSVPIVLVAIVAAIAMPGFADRNGDNSGAGIFVAIIALAVVAFVIYQLVLLHRHGQTFGKKLVGIRIVRSDGSRAGLGRIFSLRYLVPGLIGAIPLLGPIFSLIDPLFIFGEEKRCLHDMFADTIVVDV